MWVGGGGGPFMYNVHQGGAFSPPTVEIFGNLGTKYRFFVCIIKFEWTSTLAPKSLQMYMISVQGVGETVSVVKYNVLHTKGGGGGGEGDLLYVLSILL